VEGACAGHSAGGNFSPIGDVLFEDVAVFIIDELDVPLAEAAEFFLGGRTS
jgi:hypothetical protein